MELNKFFKLVYKRKYILVIVPMITVFITYFLVRKFPDTYKSHARISTGIETEYEVEKISEVLLKALESFKQKITKM